MPAETERKELVFEDATAAAAGLIVLERGQEWPL